jgi:hypothetical protein
MNSSSGFVIRKDGAADLQSAFGLSHSLAQGKADYKSALIRFGIANPEQHQGELLLSFVAARGVRDSPLLKVFRNPLKTADGSTINNSTI